jgi:hypothetical protein
MAETTLGWIASAVSASATVLVSTHLTSPFDAMMPGRLRLEAGRIVS